MKAIDNLLPSLAGGRAILVVAMACDEAILPAQDRLKQIADDYELEEILRTERQLLYVALTRARDRLIVSAVSPA